MDRRVPVHPEVVGDFQFQWIAQVQVTEQDLTSEAQLAIDHGAVGVYVHGGVGDDFVCVGMFDFQVAENAQWVARALEASRVRDRPWCA